MKYNGDLEAAATAIERFIENYYPNLDHALYEPGDVSPNRLTSPDYEGDVFLLKTQAELNDPSVKQAFRAMLRSHGLCVKRTRRTKGVSQVLIVTCKDNKEERGNPGEDIEYAQMTTETYYGITGRKKGGIEYYEAPFEIPAKNRGKLNG